jgi:nucleoside-diphosphate-sugar epimerase
VAELCVGVLGATSLVGECLLPLLIQAGWEVTAFSRRVSRQSTNDIKWINISAPRVAFQTETPVIAHWICVAPIWALSDYFEMMEACGIRRVVALSSTSRFTKSSSSDAEEQAVAYELANAEKLFRTWAESKSIEWVILRPTLIYGRGRDKNISQMVRFIRRFGFFPVLGQASGLRQPVHAEDVARACFRALDSPTATNRDYNISGAETLPYRAMVSRVFGALGSRPRVLSIPMWVFRMTVACLRIVPRYRKWSSAMAKRMNQDLVIDHSQATRDLGFEPRVFILSAEDLPRH